MRDITRRGALAGALLAGATARSSAQAWPSHPLRIVVPFAAGAGVSDITARLVAEHLTEKLGQQVMVDNKPGAGSVVGAEVVAKAPPDGYTMLMGNVALTVAPFLYAKIPFDPLVDLVPVTMVNSAPLMLVVHPSLPVKSVRELISLARRRPNDITVASSGNGSGGHLAAEMLMSMTHTRMLHVPYKGGGPALIALLAGEVQVLFATYASGKGHIQNGRMRALAVTTAKRPSALPDLPTIAEAGVPGYDSGVWYAIVAPAGTPAEIVNRLNRALVQVLKQPAYHKLLVSGAIDPIGSDPGTLGRYIKSEIAKWSKVVKEAGVKID